MSKSLKKPQAEENKCEFCNKTFVREKSLIAHTCAKKQRWLSRDNKEVVLAFYSWQQFYKLTKSASKKNQTMIDFINSKYYNDFVKFGFFILRNKVIRPESYIEYVIKNNFKLNEWYLETTYKKYIKDNVAKEDPYSGIERSLKYISKWMEDSNKEMTEFFGSVNTNVLVSDLLSGRISPWMLYICESADILINRLDDSQLKLLADILNPLVWQVRKSRFKKEVNELKIILSKSGL